MSRPRALLALVLALTWCSAIAHAHLEALGCMLEHEHYAPGAAAGCDQAPGDCPAGHEEVFAPSVAKDGSPRALVVATEGMLDVAGLTGGIAPTLRALQVEKPLAAGPCDPPGASTWRFEQRCALETAAPPTLV